MAHLWSNYKIRPGIAENNNKKKHFAQASRLPLTGAMIAGDTDAV